MQNIGFATDLAVFHIGLFRPGGFIHLSLIPLATARALKPRIHTRIVAQRRASCKGMPSGQGLGGLLLTRPQLQWIKAERLQIVSATCVVTTGS